MVHIARLLCDTLLRGTLDPRLADYFGYEAQHKSSVRNSVATAGGSPTTGWIACPRGFDEPICTFTQSPEGIAETMTTFLRKKGLVGLPEMHPQL